MLINLDMPWTDTHHGQFAHFTKAGTSTVALCGDEVCDIWVFGVHRYQSPFSFRTGAILGPVYIFVIVF